MREKMEQDMCEFKKYIKMTNDLLADSYKWLRLSQYADDESSRSKARLCKNRMRGCNSHYSLQKFYNSLFDYFFCKKFNIYNLKNVFFYNRNLFV